MNVLACFDPLKSFSAVLVFALSSFICMGSTSSTVFTERNIPDCHEPENVSVKKHSGNEFVVNWDSSAAEGEYSWQVRYKLSRNGKWVVQKQITGSKFIFSSVGKGLQHYKIEVRRACYWDEGHGFVYSNWVEASKVVQARSNIDCQNFNGGNASIVEDDTDYFDIDVGYTGSLPLNYVIYVGYRLCGQGAFSYFPIGDQTHVTKTASDFGISDLSQICELTLGIGYGESNPTFDCGPLTIFEKEANDGTGTDCGEPFTEEEPSGQEYSGTISVSDVISGFGFDFEVVEVTSQSSPFSGKVEVPVPFSDQPLLMEFSNLVLYDNMVYKSGQFTALSSNDPSIPPSNPHDPGNEFCNVLSSNEETNQHGFNENGHYPPPPGWEPGDPYDPNYTPCGFDSEGNHIETDTIYNPDGCTIDSVDADGNYCPLDCVPYYWLQNDSASKAGIAFFDSIENQLDDEITQQIQNLMSDFQDSLNQTKQECRAIADKMRDTVQTYSLDSAIIFGEQSEYIQAGLSQEFTAPIEEFKVHMDRKTHIEGLEDLHVELYECDQKEIILQEISGLLNNAASQDSIEGFKQYIEDIIKSFDEAEANKYHNDFDKFIDKLREEILVFLKNTQSGGSWGSTPVRGQQKNHHQHREQLRKQPGIPSMNIGLSSIQYMNRWVNANRLSSAASGSASLLPIVLEKNFGSQTYAIYITEISVGSEGAKLSAYFKFTLPHSSEELVFSATDIAFNPGGIANSGRLSLESDIDIKINNVATLKIKQNGTEVKWTCEGFDELTLDGHIKFCNDVLVPLDESMEPIVNPSESEYVKATFETNVKKLQGVEIQLNEVDKFAVKGAEHVRWEVGSALLDLDPTHSTASAMELPPGYKSQFIDENSGKLTPFWKGFYLESLTAYIPEFKENNQGDPLSIEVSDVLIDDGGFTGRVSIENELVSLEDGNLGNWAYSLDSIGVCIVRNELMGGALGGLIHVPIFKSNNTPSDEIAEDDCFAYTAKFVKNAGFQFLVQPGNSSKEVPIFAGKVQLDSNSTIAATFGKNDKVDLKANLFGSLSFNPGEDIEASSEWAFNDLEISNTAPYFAPGKWEIPDVHVGIKGYNISVEKVNIDSEQENGTEYSVIDFTGNLEVIKKFGLSGSSNIEVLGRFDSIQDRQIWRFEKVSVDGVELEANYKKFQLKGSLIFFDESDGTGYGEGFRGSISVYLPGAGINGEAVGLFGNKGSTEYFMVDVLIKSDKGIPVAGPVKITGIGGGLAYNMSQIEQAESLPAKESITNLEPDSDISNEPLGYSLTGTEYEVSSSTGVANFKAIVVGSVRKPSIMSLNAILEVSFYTGAADKSGIRSISISGAAQLMSKSVQYQIEPPQASFSDPGDLSNLNQPYGASTKVSAYASIELDFEDKVFHGNFGLFVNVTVGSHEFITGHAMAEIYASKTKWYFNVGRTHDNRSGRAEVEMDLAIVKIGVQAYLNIGNDIPPLPPLPPKARDIFDRRPVDASLGFGTGFAFGVHASFEKDLDFGIGSVEIEAGLGFDLALKQYSGMNCANTSGEIGINGWYANGQAYLYGSIDADLLGINLAEATVGVKVSGGAPNPTWVRGEIELEACVWIKCFDVNATLEFGEHCEFTAPPGSDLPPVISQILPSEGTDNIDLASDIRVNFNLPVNKKIETTGSNGGSVVYKVDILWDSTHLYDSDENPIEHKTNLRFSNKELQFVPENYLPEDDSIYLSIAVRVTKNGSVVNNLEKTSANVKVYTAGELGRIPANNVANTYPINGMKNYYPEEAQIIGEKGFIELKRFQPELSPYSGNRFLALLEGEDGDVWASEISVDFQEKKIWYSLPASKLEKDMEYTLSIVKVPNKDPQAVSISGPTISQINIIELESVNDLEILKNYYRINFRVSNYATLSEKINALKNSSGNFVIQGDCPATPITEKVSEGFDKVEIEQGYLSYATTYHLLANGDKVTQEQKNYLDSIKINFFDPFYKIDVKYNYIPVYEYNGEEYNVLPKSKNDAEIKNEIHEEVVVDGITISSDCKNYHTQSIIVNGNGYQEIINKVHIEEETDSVIILNESKIQYINFPFLKRFLQVRYDAAESAKYIVDAIVDECWGNDLTGNTNSSSRLGPTCGPDDVFSNPDPVGERLYDLTSHHSLPQFNLPLVMNVPVIFTYSIPGYESNPSSIQTLNVQLN